MKLRLLLAGAALLKAASAFAALTVMHGYIDYASALVWIQTDAPASVEVTWRVDGDEAMHRAMFEAREANENVVVARLTGLLPGKQVSYTIAGDGDRRDGSLRAQPRWTR